MNTADKRVMRVMINQLITFQTYDIKIHDCYSFHNEKTENIFFPVFSGDYRPYLYWWYI